jgi:hypothetical protein
MFNIFKNDDGGTHWVEAVPTLDVAKAHVLAFQEFWPAEYLIVNRNNGESVSMKTDIDPQNRHGRSLGRAKKERAGIVGAQPPNNCIRA